jgi:hypothetical protein
MIRKPRTLKANAKFNTTFEKIYLREKDLKFVSLVLDKSAEGRRNRVIVPNVRNVVARVPGVPGISTSLKKAMKLGSNDKVTSVVSRNV